MKVLTLHQPWGTLIALGLKHIETRSWNPPHHMVGQRFAIHAGKTVDTEAAKMLDAVNRRNLPVGKILATVELIDIGKVSDIPGVTPSRDWVTVYWWNRQTGIMYQPDSLGNYEPGRYLWLLGNVRQLDEPIPARGAQGLWEYKGEINT